MEHQDYSHSPTHLHSASRTKVLSSLGVRKILLLKCLKNSISSLCQLKRTLRCLTDIHLIICSVFLNFITHYYLFFQC